jgi:ribosomal protein S18 acetylase RimI-like enzyme
MEPGCTNALIAAYCNNPCEVLPNALWKTLAVLSTYKTAYSIQDSEVVSLKIWNEEELLLYWTKNRYLFTISGKYLNKVAFMIIHQDYLGHVPRERFSSQKPYFRLIHKGFIPAAAVPPGYHITEVDVDREAGRVSRFLAQCYLHLRPSAETVKPWAAHPVFDETLWIWVLHQDTPVGLGIAERDTTIHEGSLEWIQVLPAYRGRGIGRCIVVELLKRLQQHVVFTTVSGEYTQTLKRFYESCGFSGKDMWWILTK